MKLLTLKSRATLGVLALSGLLLAGCGTGGGSAILPAGQVAQVSGYMPFNAASVKQAVAEGKKTAVFFHGATCGSCAKLDADIKANTASIPSDVVVFNADWDQNQGLAKEYGVAKYHTVSYLNKDGLDKNVKGLFTLSDLIKEFDKEAVQASNYKPYNAGAVKQAVAEGKKTAIFFHGATCGSCAKLDADIKGNSANIPNDVVVFNADWDSNQELAKEYGVAKYHTVSYLNKDGLDKNVKGLFTLSDLVTEFDKAPVIGYVPYNAGAVKQAMAEGKKTAVFFHGATCGSCAKLDSDIKGNAASIPSDVVVFNADWDSNQELAKEYGVAKYHTVSYLNKDGLDKNVKGLFTLDEIVAEFDKQGASNNYQTYSAAAVKQAVAEGKKTAVFFHGASCGSCAKLDGHILENAAKIPSDVVVFNADWDTNQELAKEYGVAKYHTVSYISENGVDKNVTGLFTLDDLVNAF